MFATAALFAAIVLPQAARSAGALPPPPAQDLTLPPETASTVTILEGRGVQIYTCTADPAGYRWVYKAPDAQLFNLATGKPAGHHGAGPVWTLEDGSSVRGIRMRDKASGNPGDLPWVLMKTKPAEGGNPAASGTLASVSYIRRYNTHGGAAPETGCDVTLAGQTVRVPYTATYGFYAVPGSPSNAQTTPGSSPTRPQ